MIKSRLCELLGITYPIFQGGMAWVADAHLAATVSNAGGLGIIAAMNLDGEYLRGQIGLCRQLTDKPFGVNIMMMSPHVPEVAQVVAEEKVPVVTTGAGWPGPYMKAWLAAGIKVVPVIPSVAIAKRVVREGACAVVAEGCEAGGHIGELTTMTLVPQVVDAVEVPVLAAGGIADGRSLAAALMLGAEGVQCGTRFLTAEECTIPECYKDRVIQARDIDTVVTGRKLGHPVRALKNSYMMEFARREADSDITKEELEKFGTGALWRAARQGDMETGCVMAGQAAALVKDKLPARDIITGMFSEAETLLKDATKWLA
ncbi:MAG: enoyl-[acyl-carrier-protein] reductase FabK [Clostridiales bacterium]|nr:enoyl-[acyl-carrier-protein] reductase FabK [Clostridiales bacterium]